MKRPLNASMRMKKTLSLGFVALLLLSMTIAVSATPWDGVTDDPHNANAIWVDPNSYLTSLELDTLEYCDTFVVDVLVNISEASGGLMGWMFSFSWDPDNVNLTGREQHIPPTYTASMVIDDYVVDGTYYSSVSMLEGTNFVGVTSLGTFEFHVIESVYGAPEIGTLDIWDDALSTTGGVPISHTTDDGDYRKCPPGAALSVKPAKVHGVCGEKFNVTVEIQDLDAAWNMCGWEATLGYNTTMLDATASFEGDFLPGFAGTDGTEYINVINDSLGYVDLGGSFIGTHTTPYTVGTQQGCLAIIEFNATWQYTVSSTRFPPVTCILGLYDTLIVNCTAGLIFHTVTNATYNAPYKPQVIDHPIVFEDETYHVFTESNSSVSPVPMIFDQPNKLLSFNVTGTSGYYGYCNVTIPNNFLWAEPLADWEVLVDGSSPVYFPTPTSNGTHTFLYFTYLHPSSIKVQIIGTGVVPEFPIAMILPLLFIATLAAAILGKKVRSGKHRGPLVAE